MAAKVLSRRALNRATLERQLLLRRSELPALQAIEHLVGLQAQVPLNPYTALWSRLQEFDPDALSGLLVERRVVRTVVMRSTIHLVSADDCLLLRPLMQPVLDAELARHRDYGPALLGVDLAPVLRFARRLLAEAPLSPAELRAAIAERFPSGDATAFVYACRNHLPLVQVPPRGVWGRSTQVKVTTVEAWLGRPLAASPSLDDVVLRYLAAYGPASVADVSAWSRLTGLREVLERLRPELRAFSDESGRELFDLPDAPLPDPDTPAPPRFLPEYDNVLLSYADRSRFVSAASRGLLARVTGPIHGAVLHDGAGVGLWRLERGKDDGRATLVVGHGPLTVRARSAVEKEGQRLLAFLADAASTRDVRLVAVA